MRLQLQLILAMLILSALGLAQNPIAGDAPYQVRYATNLAIGDSVVNITNTGASASTTGFPNGPEGPNLCANVYTFSPDEQLVACCACAVTPNALVSLSVNNDLISNTLTPAHPTSVVIKLLATNGAGPCNAATAGSGIAVPTIGMAAWGTTLHALPSAAGAPAATFGVTETKFTPVTLSGAELTRITTLCGFIQTNGSGFGICRSCRLGGLGAVTQ
jgi:hypothetical protein